MDGSVVDLSKYRLERSKDDLETAESNMLLPMKKLSFNLKNLKQLYLQSKLT